MDLQITDETDERAYIARDEDGEVGRAVYRVRGDLIAFMHTETDDRVQGKGVGSELVRAALDDAKAKGLQVLPFCPFVQHVIEKTPEYADLVPVEYRAKFGLAS